MKKLLIVLIIGLILLSPAMAQELKGDCGMVVSIGDFNSLENWKYEHILPKVAIEQSMINLKNFCCKENLYKDDYTCTKDIRISNDGIFPSSVYLYDHILDVSMRRLDAKVENDNGKNLIYDLEPDETGKKWRDFITKQANSKNGSIPLQISNKFKESWEIGKHVLTDWNKKQITNRNATTFEGYKNRKLIDKYNAVCETSMYLYLSLSSDANIAKLGTAYNTCKVIAQNRVKKEFDYTKAILMQKGNRLLFNNVKSYLDRYFSQNKLIALQQLIFNIKNTFNEVNKAVIELIPKCD